MDTILIFLFSIFWEDFHQCSVNNNTCACIEYSVYYNVSPTNEKMNKVNRIENHSPKSQRFKDEFISILPSVCIYCFFFCNIPTENIVTWKVSHFPRCTAARDSTISLNTKAHFMELPKKSNPFHSCSLQGRKLPHRKKRKIRDRAYEMFGGFRASAVSIKLYLCSQALFLFLKAKWRALRSKGKTPLSHIKTCEISSDNTN